MSPTQKTWIWVTKNWRCKYRVPYPRMPWFFQSWLAVSLYQLAQIFLCINLHNLPTYGSRELVYGKSVIKIIFFGKWFFAKHEGVPQNATNDFLLYRGQHHSILVTLMDVGQCLRLHHYIAYQPKIPSLIFFFWHKTVLWYLRMP